MKVETLQYTVENGWSIPTFPDLDSESTLLFVFCAPEFFNDQTQIKRLAKQYPKSKMIGCSTAGEIYGASVLDNSISVAIAKFEKTQLKLITSTLENGKDSFQVGEEISKNLDDKNLAGIFVLSEGLKINGSELVRGLNAIDKKDIVITGGLSGDGANFKETFVIKNGEFQPGYVVAVGFYGDQIRIGHGSKGGWDIFGVERRITRSTNNILYELDGKPALELYKQYLGEKAKDLPASGLLFPLSIRKDATDQTRLVRTILSVDEKADSLIFAGDMPQGYLAQLMRANFDRLITGAKEASDLLVISGKMQKDLTTLVVAVSCVGRKLLLGQRIEEETNSAIETFPKSAQMVGFYSYGEISPYATGNCDLHNQTMTLTSFSEEM